MSSSVKFKSLTIETDSKEIKLNRGEADSFSLRVAQSETPALVKALGVLAATQQLPKIPDELNFSPFRFGYDKEAQAFMLTRNDESYGGWVYVAYEDIDSLQVLLTGLHSDIIDRKRQKGRKLARF
jgi:hypothetical protein